MSKTVEGKDLTKEEEIKLAVARERLKIFNLLDKKVDLIKDGKLDIFDFSDEIYNSNNRFFCNLDAYKTELGLSDEDWDNEEIRDFSDLTY